jgi:hypothetical protein
MPTAIELEKQAAYKKTRALEFGIDAGLEDLGIEKAAFCELVGARDDDHLTELMVEWGDMMAKCEAQAQTA